MFVGNYGFVQFIFIYWYI